MGKGKVPKGKGMKGRVPKGKGIKGKVPKGKGIKGRVPKGKGRVPKGKGMKPKGKVPKGKGMKGRVPKGKGIKGNKMKYRKNKTLKFMKGKYSFNLKTGKAFCSTKCAINKSSKERYCFKKGAKKCKACSFTGNKTTKKGKE